VLRAIGASNGKVLSMVLIEGVMIGVASWLLALAPALPLSIFVGNISGQIFLNGPLESAVSLAGIGEWLILVVVLSGLASLYPARSAARLTVREALAYG
jgi:putative ABC transport system permease protein